MKLRVSRASVTSSPRSNCNLTIWGSNGRMPDLSFPVMEKTNHWASLVTEKVAFPLRIPFRIFSPLLPFFFLSLQPPLNTNVSISVRMCVGCRDESRVFRNVPGPLIFCKRQKIRKPRETRDCPGRAGIKNLVSSWRLVSRSSPSMHLSLAPLSPLLPFLSAPSRFR